MIDADRPDRPGSALRWIIATILLVAIAAIVGVILYAPGGRPAPEPEMTPAEKIDWLDKRYADITAFMNRTDFEGAERIIHEILGKFEDEAQAWLLLGQVRIAQEDFDEAYQYTKHSIELNPDSAEKHQVAGILATQLGDLEAAKVHHRRAVEIAPDRGLYRMHLGEVFRQIGNLTKAAEQFDAALQLNPSMDEAHAGLASVRLKQDRRDEALQHITKAILLAQGHRQKRNAYLVAKSQMLRQAGRPAEAASTLESIPPAEWDEALVVELAGTYVDQKKPLEAARAWERYYEMEPDNAAAAARAGIYFHAAGRLDKATEYWVASSDSVHPDAKTLDRLMRNLKAN